MFNVNSSTGMICTCAMHLLTFLFSFFGKTICAKHRAIVIVREGEGISPTNNTKTHGATKLENPRRTGQSLEFFAWIKLLPTRTRASYHRYKHSLIILRWISYHKWTTRIIEMKSICIPITALGMNESSALSVL